MRSRAAGFALIVALVVSLEAVPAFGLAQGIVVSCPGYGRIWGSGEMVDAVEELRSLGATWVQIHPYARIHRDGRVTFTPANATGYLERSADIVQQAGLQMFLKPHLSYWGNFSWRGAIDFETREEWDVFFRDYEDFIVDQARFAESNGIPAMAVGTELEKSVRFEKEWRRIIAAVRRVYSGHLTYAANWDGFDRVPFWDALDSIGVQSYFPLGDRKSTAEQLEARWVAVLDLLEGASKRYGRPVVLAEVGFTRSLNAASEPWKAERDSSAEAIRLRTLLTDVVLRVTPSRDFVIGMFWWKWIPGWNMFQRDFSMRDTEMRTLLETYWVPSP